MLLLHQGREAGGGGGGVGEDGDDSDGGDGEDGDDSDGRDGGGFCDGAGCVDGCELGKRPDVLMIMDEKGKWQ